MTRGNLLRTILHYATMGKSWLAEKLVMVIYQSSLRSLRGTDCTIYVVEVIMFSRLVIPAFQLACLGGISSIIAQALASEHEKVR